ncbi:hypothetical protein MCOR27_010234 [Pyricularia oryzae]|uniref:Zf-CHY-domain-containing protein n=1 Tax=Pyricularia grisea TaxID=148305 RepID=A0ABQ8N6J7_PYRGI|nr:hypothetical protein MCOR01_005246 [Pyricularia oryzae]KAI6292100.1 hypothetical protein MCOR33_010108 [Pyricularia grisea]KAH9427621.1 hypothetical protein MCOR02_011857 [Pyricularia oryzae]KAI6255234.1 hypothetical protein MCOR19_008262 [Pyricularia oryzae]KAI6265552.1 hypothetical protein MCOR26_010677 [Pyricularia oryzae]
MPNLVLDSLVPAFLIEPVLRQARRFSRGNAAVPGPDTAGGPGIGEDNLSSTSTAIAEEIEIISSPLSPAAASGRVASASLAVANFTPPHVHPCQTTSSSSLPPTSSPLLTLPTLSDLAEPQSPSLFADDNDMSNSTNDTNNNQTWSEAGLAAARAQAWAATPAAPLPSSASEDDWHRVMRLRILDVQSRDIPEKEKAAMLHRLLTENHHRLRQQKISSGAGGKGPIQIGTEGSASAEQKQGSSSYLGALKFWQLSPGEASTATKFLLTEEDIAPTFWKPKNGGGCGHSSLSDDVFGSAQSKSAAVGDGSSGDQAEQRHLGCEHYRRNVKLQCNRCSKWYTCRICHNDNEDHELPRRETKHMLCMACGYAQRASDECVKCGQLAARYYCDECKLWNDNPDVSTYHCRECGICRIGAGLGKDFVHCKECGICIAIETETSHRCRSGAMDSNCPICTEDLFTSTKQIIHINPCRHLIHKRCYDEYLKSNYKCPICSKTMSNMESQFRKMDQHIADQPMPAEYRDVRAIIYCNDCEAKSQTLYHWVGMKCSICQGYNTREIKVVGAPVEMSTEAARLQEEMTGQQPPLQGSMTDAALAAASQERSESTESGLRRLTDAEEAVVRHWATTTERDGLSARAPPPFWPPSFGRGDAPEGINGDQSILDLPSRLIEATALARGPGVFGLADTPAGRLLAMGYARHLAAMDAWERHDLGGQRPAGARPVGGDGRSLAVGATVGQGERTDIDWALDWLGSIGLRSDEEDGDESEDDDSDSNGEDEYKAGNGDEGDDDDDDDDDIVLMGHR